TRQGIQEEQKIMLSLMRAKFVMKIHGEYRMLKEHTGLATDCGVNEKNTLILDNGEVLALNKDKANIAGKVPSGSIYVDGSGIGVYGNIVLCVRRILYYE